VRDKRGRGGESRVSFSSTLRRSESHLLPGGHIRAAVNAAGSAPEHFQRVMMPIALTRRINSLTEGLTSVIAQLKRQKTAIERALTALREVEGVEPAGAAPAPAIAEPATRKRAGRNRRSLAQKKRWALKRAAEAGTPTVPTKAAPRKGSMTEDGRRRLAEAMKRRWAVKRAASAVKKTARKQRAARKAA
jgi:hypothetical protein